MHNNAVVTFAIGKIYQKYALGLADSFLLYNSLNEISFFIITDKSIQLDTNLNPRINVIVTDCALYGEDVLLNKFRVKQYVRADNILLIDSDSFICADLNPVFQLHANADVVIWGTLLRKDEEWRGNSLRTLNIEKIDELYKINGGVYFFGNSASTESFFLLCDRLIINYEANGFAKVYNDYKDDEIIFSTASAISKIPILLPDNNIKVETMYFSRRFINIFFGYARFYHNNFERWKTSNEEANNPMIICFDRGSVTDFDYTFSCSMLKLCKYGGGIRVMVSLLATFVLKIYYTLKYLKWNMANIKKAYQKL